MNIKLFYGNTDSDNLEYENKAIYTNLFATNFCSSTLYSYIKTHLWSIVRKCFKEIYYLQTRFSAVFYELEFIKGIYRYLFSQHFCSFVQHVWTIYS